jgi:hypothetical protein
MPAVPGTRLGVIEPEFGLRGLERILGRPAAALNCDQCFDPETVWYLSTGVSKAFFAALPAALAEETGAAREHSIVLVLDNAGWHASSPRSVGGHHRRADGQAFSPEPGHAREVRRIHKVLAPAGLPAMDRHLATGMTDVHDLVRDRDLNAFANQTPWDRVGVAVYLDRAVRLHLARELPQSLEGRNARDRLSAPSPLRGRGARAGSCVRPARRARPRARPNSRPILAVPGEPLLRGAAERIAPGGTPLKSILRGLTRHVRASTRSNN